MSGAALQIWGLTKDYGSTRVLDDVTLDVAAGEFLTLLGPSGSGKTTVLMAVAGFVSPTHGDIFCGGRSIANDPAEKRDFGVVFQGYALFPHLTVAGNVAFPLKVRGLGRAERDARVREVLDLVRLDGLADRKPRELSGGQQQRVALARALAFRPKILLLDEPMGALDRKLKADLQGELRRLHRTLGTTFVNVTHDQDEAMNLSDRIAIMDGGRLIEIGSPSSLYARPRTRFAAGFLGRNNILEGQVVAIEDGAAMIDVGSGILRHALDPSDRLAVGEAATVALRPERIEIRPMRPGIDTGLDGTIIDIVTGGATVEVLAAVSDGRTLWATLPFHGFDAALGRGTPIALSWTPDATVAIGGRSDGSP
ncbi:ABC transporter ATP-binding protein [Mongoliimonas terrestris]|uniref:ABC transporter ATP-binding protein n=1 Tax=Mongoliimonas terrestris TaxID=1709001 RepID=UPI0009498270|nr:ABC transporter ATP-binding protein [Mongoliimonas terrestris]